jgi:hypothetical protein
MIDLNDANVPDNRNTSEPDNDLRPIINTIGGGLTSEVNDCERVLLEAGEPFFQRSSRLVRPVTEETDASHGRRTVVARLQEITAPFLRDTLCRVAIFQTFDQRKKAWRAVNPPLDHAATLLARVGQWKFQTVTGITTTPTLRPDGSLLDRPGYDAATRLILTNPPVMPAIPEKPTREEAEAALNMLASLLSEFPFANEASRSVGLSAILTAVCRGAFQNPPLHVARASTAGTGKSFLWDVVSMICLGRPCPVMAAGRTEEETEKRLGAALLASQPLICLDNVNGVLGGDALAQAIERPVVEVRILGRSELVRIESRSTMLATGNNIILLGDMTRRAVVATLEANMERPELRQFSGDPVARILENRGIFICAALVVVRAYIAAGRPGKLARLASFEGWSDTVRSALVWLGYADPVTTMEAARDEDPHLRGLQAIVGALKQAGCVGPSNARSTSQIVAMASETEPLGRLAGEDGFRYPDLRAALLDVAGTKGVIDAQRLGTWFGKNQLRIVDGCRLQRVDAASKIARWCISPITYETGDE